MQRIFHTPEGVRDIYGKECRQKKRLEGRIHEVFRLHGFEDIETPSFEFFEVFSNEVGTIPSRELFKFFDRDNNTLTLRPDFTPSVSRACATYYSPEKSVVNLCYTGSAFVNRSSFQGRLKESTQMGVEKMGDNSAAADAEILAMAVESLAASGLREFQLSIGQVDYFKSLLEEVALEPEKEELLRSLISQKNYFAVEALVREEGISGRTAEAFSLLPRMFGQVEVLGRARSLTDSPRAIAAVRRLEEIYELLKVYGYEDHITFDFGMLSKYNYYTGIIFQAYTYGSGEPLLKGGRYDELMRHFGKPAPSVGFVIVVDSLQNALVQEGYLDEPEEEKVTVRYRKDNAEAAIREAASLRQAGKCELMVPEEEEGRV